MKKAILIIHGLAGGTYDQENLARFLQLTRSFDVFYFTLPGHDVKDISKTNKDEWTASTREHIEYLIKHKYRTIYLVGHSMGGVIAAFMATQYKQVKKVVLVAPSYDHFEKEAGSKLNVLFKTPELINAYGVEEFLTRLNKLPFTALNEFKSLVEKYQESYKNVKVPIMIVHGSLDQMVPIDSTKLIYNQLTVKKKYLEIEGYYHDVFKGNKVDLINTEIRDFLKKPTLFLPKAEIKTI